MAGHSKWANIKHKKAATDAKRGKMWSKLSKAIIVAAKQGGADPSANARLRTAIADAKAVSMPKDNIERAIRKGSGESDGDNYEEIIYEGYGPGGVAVMCECLTDKRTRTGPELNTIFKKNGGEVGKSGCVSYLFERKGLFVFAGEGVDEEQLTELALENGAEDIETLDDGKFQVTCTPDSYEGLSDAFQAAELTSEVSQVSLVAQTTVDMDADAAKKVLRLLEALDDHDDVQNVSTNLNMTDEMFEDE